MSGKKGKTPSQSSVLTRYILMPHQANPSGTAFGGEIVAWMDMVAGMAAYRHAGQEVVTVSIDTLSFIAPVYVGEQVVLKASVNYVGRTSMEVGIKVIKDDSTRGTQVVATTAYMTFVALDENKRPAELPRLLVETDEDKRRFEQGKQRFLERKKRREKCS
ncbi:MAG: acyl-CoA thioesterase [Planctomycetes bacterium]|nr:acyl-CoA thioesterase [Planctomycetota bacterium]